MMLMWNPVFMQKELLHFACAVYQSRRPPPSQSASRLEVNLVLNLPPFSLTSFLPISVPVFNSPAAWGWRWGLGIEHGGLVHAE